MRDVAATPLALSALPPSSRRASVQALCCPSHTDAASFATLTPPPSPALPPKPRTGFSASVRAKSSPAQQSQGYRYPAPGTGNGREAPSVPEYFNEDRAYRLK